VAFLAPIPETPVLRAHLNLPQLTIPKDYMNCLVTTKASLSAAVSGELSALFADPTVATVVLTYENHGGRLPLGDGERLLTSELFMSWADAAGSQSTRLLVILDVCYSTYFARTIWRDLMKGRLCDRLSAFVGFITVSDVGACLSNVLISTNPELVYQIDTHPPWKEGEWFPGFITHHSMFMRVFLYLWTYTLENTGLLMRDLPGLINAPGDDLKRKSVEAAAAAATPDGHAGPRPAQTVPSPAPEAEAPAPTGEDRDLIQTLAQERGSFWMGFDAKFVGDPDHFGALQVVEFFPLGPNASTAPMDGCGDRAFAQVIPFAAPGELDDDVQGYGPQLPTNCSPDDGFLVIDTSSDKLVRVQRKIDGSLVEQPIGDDATLLCISTAVTPSVGAHPSDAKRKEGLVRWGDFLFACLRAMGRWVPDKNLLLNSTWVSGMQLFLEDVNKAPLASKYDTPLYTLAFYYAQIGQNPEFLAKIKSIHAELMKKPGRAPAPK
jgi:hypothetical protein